MFLGSWVLYGTVPGQLEEPRHHTACGHSMAKHPCVTEQGPQDNKLIKKEDNKLFWSSLNFLSTTVLFLPYKEMKPYNQTYSFILESVLYQELFQFWCQRAQFKFLLSCINLQTSPQFFTYIVERKYLARAGWVRSKGAWILDVEGTTRLNGVAIQCQQSHNRHCRLQYLFFIPTSTKETD